MVVVCMLLSFVSCNKISEKRIVGTWTITSAQTQDGSYDWIVTEANHDMVGKEVVFQKDGLLIVDGEYSAWSYMEASESLFIDGLEYSIDEYKNKSMCITHYDYSDGIYADRIYLKKK